MSVSPPSSNHRNGVNNASHNGSNDLTNGSQVAILGGMQMKVSSRGKCHQSLILIVEKMSSIGTCHKYFVCFLLYRI